ncbi:adenosylcobinamide-GDP ribazoletransferase [Streptomyces sp. H27-D2]|uniref:adenosylcobinamide-GDP ribazoletransferase n=1 Tax=Streptomyces sp. H27-D2 TaxID=3046304 RepID=UPI002DBD1A7D|nr:adenosylcobinamide-GDP ribazoletransferase [Streptomyces sp. H27-D2]MEC4017181.1 adenosylcobinamide-GDP ribazoletransferase [Streptomyces sp. H27-D2]
MPPTTEPPIPPAPPPGAEPPRAPLLDGLRFAFGTLTALPVRVARWDRQAARVGMLCAPVAGLVIGLFAAAVGGALLLCGGGPLLAAVATVAVPAALTRGLHLDGLADTADGLGSAKPAPEALRVMKQSDIGPFGVLTLFFVLFAQVAVMYELYEQSWARGALAIALAVTLSRGALTLASRAGVPAARPEGLGAAVAEVLTVRSALIAAALAVAAGAASGALLGPYGALHAGLAALAALGVAELLLRHCRKRFGGVTGDVFGALAETAATAALVTLALG